MPHTEVRRCFLYAVVCSVFTHKPKTIYDLGRYIDFILGLRQIASSHNPRALFTLHWIGLGAGYIILNKSI